MTDDSASRRKDAWLPEHDYAINTMRAEKYAWKAIAERVGRSVEACCGRYRALVPTEDRIRCHTGRRWTPAEESELQQMLDDGKSLPEIVAATNKPRKVVYAKIEYMSRPIKRVHLQRIPRAYVPPARLADRDRRMAAEMDLTAEFFGDPRPGQSALDKKQGAFA